MHEDRDQWGQYRVCINSLKYGTLMRFVNHSCNPNARFHEVANGSRRTVVIATLAYIEPGVEVTVDYGDDRWFDCWCVKCDVERARVARTASAET